MASRPIRVGLFWHSANSGNLGVGALTISNMAIAKAVAAELGLVIEFKIFGMRDVGPRYVAESDAAVFVIDRNAILNPRECWSLIGEQDCILDIGAGDSFTDIYGMKRFLFLWLTKVMATLRRVPLVLSPQTIGPFTKTPYKQMARFALTRADVVVARDQMSLDALRVVAPKANSALAVDVAFALPFTDRSSERGGAKARVGVNVSGLLFNEARSGRNRFGLDVDYAALMTRFLEAMAMRPDVEVHLVAHAGDGMGGWDDDDSIADELALAFPQVVRVPTFAGPSEAKSYISSLDFLVAGRMHACIAALSTGTPVLPVAYSRKFAGLFGMLDYSWLIPVRDMNVDQALIYLMDCLDLREKLRSDAIKSMTKVSSLLDNYRNELRRIFVELGERAQ